MCGADKLKASVSLYEKCKALQETLQEMAEQPKDRNVDGVLIALALHIWNEEGKVKVNDLAKCYGLSRQTLINHIKGTKLGLTLVEFIRAVRFEHTKNKLLKGLPKGWTQFATDCGYYDRPHMIREFNYFTGFPPLKFVQKVGGK